MYKHVRILENIRRFCFGQWCKDYNTMGMANFAVSSTKLDTADFAEIRDNPVLRSLDDLFRQYGYEVRIAGGAVRDLLMGIKPKDIDFSTTATPKQMKDMFESEKIRMLNLKGESHGTITCRIHDENYEFTTLRIDLSCDGRHSEVQFITDWEKDASRRDLTINAMYLDFDGNIYDFNNGMEDVKNRRVAFVGDPTQRITEDYLRILRYFRFYGRIAKFPYAHDTRTLDAIRSNITGLEKISGPRIWSELKKMAVGNFAAPVLRTMFESGAAPYLGFSRNPDIDEFERKLEAIRDLEPEAMTLISTLLKDSDEVLELTKRLQLSNKERETGLLIVDYRDGDSWRLLPKPQKFFQDFLLDLQFNQSIVTPSNLFELLKYVNEREMLKNLQCWTLPKFEVNGHVLLEHGIEKGPKVKLVRKALFELWKQSHYKMTVEELLQKIPDIT